MIKKRLSKTIWYGSDVDDEGNPVVPELADGSNGSEGLHHGELYLHEADDNLSLWARTLTDQVKPIGGLGGGGSLWKLMETESGEKYLYTEYNVATQKGITSYVDGKMLDLPSIYDGLPIDNQTLYWEEVEEEVGTDEEGNPVYQTTRILKAKGGSSSGDGSTPDLSAYATMEWTYDAIKAAEGVILQTWLSGSGNAITSIALGTDKKSLVIEKGETFATQEWVTDLINSSGGSGDGSTDSSSLSVGSSGDGNAFTSYTYINGTLTLIKGSTFALQSDLNTLLGVVTNKLNTSTFESWKSENELLIANGNTAYDWGDHSEAGYATESWVTGKGYLTSHQTIYNLTFQSGAFSATTFDPNGASKTVKIPTTTDHISEGGNLYFTEERVVNALGSTLSNYVDLTSVQTITGKKNFTTGGLFVNGKQIKYNSAGYWMLEGDLLITGGITAYANEGTYTPSTIMDALVLDSNTLEINDDGQLTVIGGISSGGDSSGSTTTIYPLTIKNSTGTTQLTYNPSSASASLTLNKSMIGLSNVENTALSTWTGSTNITKVGTITSGTWQGSKIQNAYLANNSITIAGQSVSLGGSITALTLKTKLDIVTLSDSQEITGEKDFTGGLKVNGVELEYDSTNKYWKINGDLLVTGGITAYADSSSYTPSTIMDAINVDGTTISKANGYLEVIGGTGGGTADSVAWSDITGKPSWIGSTKPTYSYSEISGTPSSLKNPYSLTFGSKTYDGSSAKTILASDLGALTSHQTIYSLTIATGTASSGTYTPNSAAKTIYIPTTTSHISEGNKLYFTEQRAIDALADTLTSYVDLDSVQNISAKKHFNGGLTIGGGEIEYNEAGYWKLTGNLLVTGGITAYSTDGEGTPFVLDAESIDLITSTSTTQVYSAKTTALIKEEVASVGTDAASALAKLAIIKEKLSAITDSSLFTNVRPILIDIANSI